LHYRPTALISGRLDRRGNVSLAGEPLHDRQMINVNGGKAMH
jgi:hypothetical protein